MFRTEGVVSSGREQGKLPRIKGTCLMVHTRNLILHIRRQKKIGLIYQPTCLQGSRRDPCQLRSLKTCTYMPYTRLLVNCLLRIMQVQTQVRSRGSSRDWVSIKDVFVWSQPLKPGCVRTTFKSPFHAGSCGERPTSTCH